MFLRNSLSRLKTTKADKASKSQLLIELRKLALIDPILTILMNSKIWAWSGPLIKALLKDSPLQLALSALSIINVWLQYKLSFVTKD